jgi:hypothetical protein
VALLTTYGAVHNGIFQQIAPLAALALIYAFPGGLLELFTMMRDSVLRIVAQRHQIDLPGMTDAGIYGADGRRLIPLAEPLTGTGLSAIPGSARYRTTSRFHGRVAVAGDTTTARDSEAIAAAAEALREEQPLALSGTIEGDA